MKRYEALLEEARREIREVDVDAARARWSSPVLGEGDTTFLDVRERDEFDEGHIEGAVWVPRGALELRIEAALPELDRPLVVYCSAGMRSALAAQTLGLLGYEDVVSMEGGLRAWKQRGLPVHIPRALNAEARRRYSRHLRIPEIGEAGQRALLDARVLVIGAGGLGSPAALYLAAAGVGTIGVVDSDVVDRSNLQRQILHTDARVGMAKAESARRTLLALNPEVNVEARTLRLDASNIDEIFAAYDVIIDGADNFTTRFLVNDTAVAQGLPLVHGSVHRFDGQITTFVPGAGPCYRCLFPAPPPPGFAPSCEEAGVIGALPGVIGVMQALEAIKLIVGCGEPLIGRLLCYDGLESRVHTLRLKRNPACPGCGEGAR